MGYYVNRAMCIIAPISAVATITFFVLAIWSTGDLAGRFGTMGGLFLAVTFISTVAAITMYNEVHKPYRAPKPKKEKDNY